MVMSIGTVRPFRRGEISLHPFGFFTAALQVIAPRGFCFNRLEDIAHFLLIARFGVYFYIGCSIWEISRICMRICIELNLHRNSPDVAADQDRRAIIFWESYSLDRFASAMLGRPFGIDDQDIEISTPKTTPSLQSSHGTFSHMVELALISSQMHRALHQETHAPQINDGALLHSSRRGAAIYTTLATFHQKLAHWRSTAPIQDCGTGSPPACAFHMPEYFELRYQEERLTLIRAVIEASRRRGPPGSSRLHDGGGPGGGGLFPSGILQSSCLEAAVGVICAYDVLQRRGVIMYSRYYMHVLFSAGILIILVVFLRIDIKGRGPTTRDPGGSNSDGGCRSRTDAGFTTRYSSNVVDLSDWLSQSVAPGSERPQDISLDRALEVLTTVGDLLSWLAEQMPDSALYSRVFDALRQNMERMVHHHHHHHHHQSLRKGQSIPVHVAGAVPNEPTFPLPAQSTADPPGESSNIADFNLNLGLDYSPSVGTEPSLTELLGELFPDIPVDMLGDMGVSVSPGEQAVWPLSEFPFMPPGFMENH
ncbi:fungal specific transcription factor domain-containing protein [Aspergillus puulaauensis]|uniref:Xylanolytic transcriptional activator regulatory domain-containing protein n=1 Tax=Aspergillus puulaauensis TaxID=1220207 RepID=A0A7R7XZ04_9EURO|nr:uncharacterized protein APUU_71103S [Aspergillus puulaauensis]BCS29533.1 hypothetical protein APUU_71103S [Aspergillus puulaauensis]